MNDQERLLVQKLHKKNEKIVNRTLIDKFLEMQISCYQEFIYDFEFFHSSDTLTNYQYHYLHNVLQRDIYQSEFRLKWMHNICGLISKLLSQKQDCFLLRQYGQDVKQVSKFFKQNLIQIAAFRYNYQVLKHVLQHVTNINYNKLCSPLHQAIFSEIPRDRFKKVQLLLLHKANVNQASHGTYPIQLAWEYNQFKIVHLLISSGAKTNLLDLRNKRSINENLFKYKKHKLIIAKLDFLDYKYKTSNQFLDKFSHVVSVSSFFNSSPQIKQHILQSTVFQQSILDIVQVYFDNLPSKNREQAPPVPTFGIPTS